MQNRENIDQESICVTVTMHITLLTVLVLKKSHTVLWGTVFVRHPSFFYLFK